MKYYGFLLLLSAVVLSTTATASAQIAEMTPARQRAENRRALRDAGRYPAQYKESHLAVKPASFKRGESGRQPAPDGRRRYKFDKTGTPRVSEPTAPGLRRTRKKPSTI